MAAVMEADASVVWVPAYVGLGSNLDNPVAQVMRAMQEMRGIAGVHFVAGSHFYKNPPMGPQDQPECGGCSTDLAAPASNA